MLRVLVCSVVLVVFASACGADPVSDDGVVIERYTGEQLVEARSFRLEDPSQSSRVNLKLQTYTLLVRRFKDGALQAIVVPKEVYDEVVQVGWVYRGRRFVPPPKTDVESTAPGGK